MIIFTLYLITQLLEFVNLTLFSTKLLGIKHSITHFYSFTLIILTVVAIFQHYNSFSAVNLLATTFFVFSTMFSECYGTLRDKILLTLLYQGLGMISEVFIVFLFTTFFDFSPTDISQNVSVGTLATLLSRIFLFFLIRVIASIYHKKKDDPLSKMHTFLMLLIPLGSMYLIHIQTQDSLKKNQFTIHDLITVGIILSLNLVTYYFHENVISSTTARLQAQKYEQQVELYEKVYLSQLSADEKSAALRHDLNNHLITLERFCEENNLEAIQRYLEQIKQDSSSSPLIVNTGNLSIDAILTSKYNQASSLGIGFQMELQLPKNLSLNSMHITILLGNLLDNAIEACEKLAPEEETQISVFLRYDKPNLILCLKNNFDGKPVPLKPDLGIPKSSSKQEKGHGLGMKNVMEIVQKYNGRLKMSPEGTVMKIQIILYEIID